jgi:hypothetical protein
MKRLGLVIGIVYAGLVSAQAARAAIVVAVDVHGSKAVGDGSDSVATGFGINGRLGYLLPIPLVDVTPELQIGWTRFGATYAPPGSDLSDTLLTCAHRLRRRLSPAAPGGVAARPTVGPRRAAPRRRG